MPNSIIIAEKWQTRQSRTLDPANVLKVASREKQNPAKKSSSTVLTEQFACGKEPFTSMMMGKDKISNNELNIVVVQNHVFNLDHKVIISAFIFVF